ncbi:MAG: hypothetical protein V4558_02320 [Gemmatimonadota bacterium]
MRNTFLVIACGFLVAACGGSPAPAPVDSAALAKQRLDSTLAERTSAAPALLAEARGVMAQLLSKPATALFDSLRVSQPAVRDGAWPPPAVCGRLGGKPGVSGSKGMTPFIYMNRMTVFVLDGKNQAQFSALYDKSCGGPGARVLLE